MAKAFFVAEVILVVLGLSTVYIQLVLGLPQLRDGEARRYTDGPHHPIPLTPPPRLVPDSKARRYTYRPRPLTPPPRLVSSCHFNGNFRQGSVPRSGLGVSWRVPFQASRPCAGKGVLQLTPPAGKTTLTIRMVLSNPTGFTFHVGDSPSNDGWGGDYGHTNNEAEIHNAGKHAYLYRAYTGRNRQTLQSSIMRNSVQSGSYTITIKKPVGTRDLVSVKNSHGVDIDFFDPLLFVWDTMYMGINRVVYRSSRSGTGLCSVCITWS